MRIRVEITEADLKRLVVEYLLEHFGTRFQGNSEAVRIEVKSKQNFKAEWEVAAFRAVYEA